MVLTIVTMNSLEDTWVSAAALVILTFTGALAAAFIVEFNFGKAIARRAALHIWLFRVECGVRRRGRR